MNRRLILLLLVVGLTIPVVSSAQSYPPEVDAAMADVNARLGTSYRLQHTVNWYWEERTFPDASMGCPARGVEYAPVETAGFAIFITIHNQIFEYRAAVRSGTAIFCGSQPAAPPPAPPTRPPGNWEYSAARGSFNPYLAWSPSGAFVAVSGRSDEAGMILLYDPDDLDVLPLEIPLTQPVTALEYLQIGASIYLVTGGERGAVSLFQVEPDRSAVAEMRSQDFPAAVTAVSISGDGGVIASANAVAAAPDSVAVYAIHLWSAATGEYLRTFNTPAPVTSLDFNTAEMLLAAGMVTGGALLIDYVTGDTAAEIVPSAGQPFDSLTTVRFSADESQLAVASGTQVTVWAVSGVQQYAAPVQTFSADSPIRTFAFSPDSAAAAGGDLETRTVSSSVIRVWNRQSGANTAVLRAHTAAVNSIAFSPDGTRLASVSYDGTLRIWRFGPIH